MVSLNQKLYFKDYILIFKVTQCSLNDHQLEKAESHFYTELIVLESKNFGNFISISMRVSLC